MLIRILPALAAPLLLAAGASALAPHSSGVPLLPDLDQEAPSELVVTRAGGEYRLGFRSAVRNVGTGALVITGSRPDRSLDTMVADQIVEQAGAPLQLVRGVGRLRYVVSPDHRHWHLLGFERYELTGADGRVVVRDRKTGFCLGDRYQTTETPTGKRYTSRCGLGEPARLGIEEGISVGYGDAYTANLEGQYLPLNGLRDGRYVLVHRVNADRRLRELRVGNNAASVRLSLRWRGGVPRVRVLAVCPDAPRC
jgi:Lysyl oxidase